MSDHEQSQVTSSGLFRPATEKARRPYIKQRCRRGTNSWWQLADRRCCRQVMSQSGMQHSVRYCGALNYRHRWLLGDGLKNDSPYPIGPLSVCLSVSPVLSCLSVTLVYCGQTVGWIKMKLGVQVGLGPGHIVLDGDPAPPKGHSPQFSARVACGQMAGWIKMPLRMEVGLSPGDCVRWGPSSPLP